MSAVRRIVLAAMLAGCAASESTPSTACVGCPIANLLLGVEVTPVDPTQMVPIERSLTVDPQTGRFMPVVFATPAVLSGQVRVRSGVQLPAQFLNALVHATRPSRIPGRADVFYDGAVDPATNTYRILVSPVEGHEVYTLQIVSSDASVYPPQTFQLAISGDTTFDLVLDDPTSLLQITGTIWDHLQKGIPSLEVVAVDPTTGAPMSTTTTTDAGGNFAVRVAGRAPAKLSLVARPVGLQIDKLPTLVTPVDTSLKTPATNTLSIPNVTLPAFPSPQPFTYGIVGKSTSGGTPPVANALCRFTTDLSEAGSPTVATFTALAQANAEGKVTVNLIPSSSTSRVYSAIVSPPASSHFQTVQGGRFDVGPTGGVGADFVLDLRPHLTGAVFDSQGMPAKDVVIVPGLSTAAKVRNAQDLAAAQSPTEVTGADGTFSVWLDADTYDLGFWPTGTAPLPRWWLTGQNVTGDASLGTIRLPAGVMASVLTLGPAGDVVAGADVRVYAVAPTNYAASCKTAGCLAPPRLLAHATTDGSGQAPIILPAAAPAAK